MWWICLCNSQQRQRETKSWLALSNNPFSTIWLGTPLPTGSVLSLCICSAFSAWESRKTWVTPNFWIRYSNFVYKAESVNKDHFGVDTAECLERARKILLSWKF